MNELFSSIRADLTDRRLLPVVALVGACLVAAVAYAVLGGSSSAGGPGSPVGVPNVTPPSGIAVTGTTPEHAVAETTDGFKEQSSGKARNPFSPLPGSGSTSTTAKTASAGSSAGSSSGSGSGGSTEAGGSTTETGSSGGTETKTEPQTKKKTQTAPKTVYDVAIEFGTLPPGITPETAQLTPFTKLKLQTPLPNATTTVLVFRGVTAKGRSATFSIVGEAFPAGTGVCLPSPVQCEAVDLKPGATEQFSVYNADGSSTIYELRVLTIAAEKKAAKSNAKSARAASVSGWQVSKAGWELLRKAGRLALPFLRYSSQPGVLVFAPRHASAAHARSATR